MPANGTPARTLEDWLPFLDLRGYQPAWFSRDVAAALALAFIVVPQGVAYALIAGLPPYMGLYAAALPVIVGSLLRSSRQVITGPTNAVSVLIGASVVFEVTGDPVAAAGTLALLVGLFQIAAGGLRLGALVDYISSPVLLGFITGAGLLIGVGQLPNITHTEGASGNVFQKIAGWAAGLDAAHWPSVAMALGTIVFVVALRRIDRRAPGATLAMIGATALSMGLDLQSHGMAIVADIHPVPSGLPAFAMPDLSLAPELVGLAGAVTVLSLVESSAMARALAGRSGQRLSLTSEFIGEGLANITSALFGGYPTAGSLSRSALNERAGAATRLAGALSGALILLVLLLFGPLVDYTPIASLAGLLMVVSVGLVERHKIKVVIKSHNADRMAFAATLLGCWFLHLDQAIYLGVAISLVLFLQRARLLSIRKIGVDTHGRIREASFQPGQPSNVLTCKAIEMVNLEGPLFFGAANQLESALDGLAREPELSVLLVRLKRTQHIDVTSASVFQSVSARLGQEGRALVLVGMKPGAMRYLERTGFAASLGAQHLFPTQGGWFEAMEAAVRHSLDHAGEHDCQDEGCPLKAWVSDRQIS